MALISNRPLSELLEFILELAFKVIRAERGVLMLPSEGAGLSVEAVRTSDGKSTPEEIAFSRTIADKVVKEKVSILTKNALSRIRASTGSSPSSPSGSAPRCAFRSGTTTTSPGSSTSTA